MLILTPAADLYGSDRALLLALPALLESFEVTLVSAADGPLLPEVRALGVEVHRSDDWALRRRGLRLAALPATSLALLRSARLLRRLHREQRFDVVYANTVANALLPFLRRLLPKAMIVVHVREVPRDRSGLATVLFRAVDRVAHMVVCNSAFTGRLVGELAPNLRGRIRVVPDGIEPLAPVEVGDPTDPVLDVVCVARIHPKKGQGVLLDAAKLAVADGHRWRLHFWGDALAEHAELEASLHAAAADPLLEGRVHWHGYDADTRRLYEGMDVAVVPSVLPEEFSLVTAEAQVVGLPVVATGPGGPSDILVEGRTGTIVPPNDPAALAAAIVALEDPAKRQEWGSAGRARILERFTVERYGPAVAAALCDAVGIAPPDGWSAPLRRGA